MLAGIAIGALSFAVVGPGFAGRAASAQEESVARPPPSPVKSVGIAGLADSKAVLDWKKLVLNEARASKSAVRAPRIFHRPIPVLHSGMLVPENGGEPNPEETGVPVSSPAPTMSFAALGDNGTAIPPDTQGTVGLNHVMVTLNSQVRIQDKTGNVLSTVSLASFWSGLGITQAYDPRVAYDPFNNRWIFSAGGEPESSSAVILIGVSQTSDPQDKWNLYKIKTDASGQIWADFPTLGFNGNWIVVQANMFTVSNNAPVGSNIWAFNKADLYSGGNGTYTLLQSGGFTQCPVITYDNSLQTEYLIENFNGRAGKLRLSKIAGPIGAETLTSGVAFPSTNDHWQATAPAINFAPQLGSSSGIDTNDDRILNCVYRNDAVWAAQTIYLPSSGTVTRSSAQWWQIDTKANLGRVLQLGRIDDPTNGLFFAYPTITVNKNSDVLIGYSRFGTEQYVSANYALRRAADPLNTTESDTVLKSGEGPYFKDFGSGDNRWGDFSNTTVDPVNDTDLWTIQEYASSGNNWGTWWGKLTLADTPPTLPPGKLILTPARLGFRSLGTGTNSSKILTIRNPAPHSTLVGSIGALSAPFSLTSGGGSFSLGSGEATTVTVQFAPDSPGRFSDTLRITSNDPKHQAVNFPVTGNAVPGRLVIPRRVGFSKIASGETTSRTFFVRNPGLGVLHGSVNAASGPFRIMAGLGGFVLSHGGSNAVTVNFEPLSRGISSGAMIITSDDPTHTSVTVALSGSAR
jgi:hypothetical protein